jgi:hypothetical protein
MAKSNVFISHTRTETELAQILKKHLAKDFLGSFDIYVSSDATTIKLGTKWLEDLERTLKESQVEIVLCSKASVSKPWVNFEAGAGWIRGIRVIPVCHSGLTQDELPTPLNSLQGIMASESRSLQQLYEAIAEVYEMRAPEPDFEVIAREIAELEEKYKQAGQALERIENPRILCGASEQYTQYGFDLDVAVLEKAFPQRVTVERELTAERLRGLLLAKHFDIIHLVVAVDKDSGDLIFSPTDDNSKPFPGKVDKMSPDGFAALVGESKTRLTFMATCNALFLAVEVARVTNIIATNKEITGDEASEWGEWFYDLLARGYPLSKAYEITRTNSKIPMRLIALKDVAFAPEPKRT